MPKLICLVCYSSETNAMLHLKSLLQSFKAGRASDKTEPFDCTVFLSVGTWCQKLLAYYLLQQYSQLPPSTFCPTVGPCVRQRLRQPRLPFIHPSIHPSSFLRCCITFSTFFPSSPWIIPSFVLPNYTPYVFLRARRKPGRQDLLIVEFDLTVLTRSYIVQFRSDYNQLKKSLAALSRQSLQSLLSTFCIRARTSK